MPRSKEEIRKLIHERLSQDCLANRSFEALKEYAKLYLENSENSEAGISIVGCYILLCLSFEKQSIILLAEEGWFPVLDIAIGEMDQLGKFAEDGDSERIDQVLSQAYRKKTKRLEKKIISSFPNRKYIISQAFEAHRRKHYYVSVPALLAQADGIAKEITRGEFFLKADGTTVFFPSGTKSNAASR